MEISAMHNSLLSQTAQKAQAVPMPQQPKADADKADSLAVSRLPHDEYVSGEPDLKEPEGLYRVVPGDAGKPRVLYNDPQKSAANPPKNKEAKTCTTNTDQVDREIEKLKEKKEQLEQQIRQASGDEKKIKELKEKLSDVERELSQKDQDAYRRQHAEIS